MENKNDEFMNILENKNKELMCILEDFGIPVIYGVEHTDKSLIVKDTIGAVVTNNVFKNYNLTNKKKKQLYAINGLVILSSVVGLIYTIKTVRDAK